MSASKGIDSSLFYQSLTYEQTMYKVYSSVKKDTKDTKNTKNSGNKQPDFLDFEAAKFIPSEEGTKLSEIDLATIKALKMQNQKHFDTLRDMVNKLTSGQSYYAAGQITASYEAIVALRDENGRMESYGFKFDFSFSYEYYSSDGADEVRKQAQDLISEDGALGVKQVSENILNFAKAISGGDSSKIEFLREACKKGYNEVAALFGGADKMPEISKQTMEAVMKGFDEWAESVKSVTK